MPDTAPHHEVLVNLGDAEVPAGFERFERLVEVVTAHDEADRLAEHVRAGTTTSTAGTPIVQPRPGAERG